jgi:regulator of protease activity HflC (stomatin/prohibitin superfamily)
MANVDPTNIAAKSRLASPILAGFAVLLIVILPCASIAYVPVGSVGVLSLFGRVTGEILPAGIHFVSPFKVNHRLSIQTQTHEEHTSTPSMEGLNLEMDTSLMYHLNPEKAADVYRTLGQDYAPNIIGPNLRSIIRDTTASHSANALYSSPRKQVEDEIAEELKKVLEPRGIIIENIRLRDIHRPHTSPNPSGN